MKNFFLDRRLIYFVFLFFAILKINNAFSEDKIYLDIQSIQFDHKLNYKKYQTTSQLTTKTDLDVEVREWIKKNIILKGNSGKLTIKILDESIIDSFVQEHKKKFTFLPKDGISYKINFKVKIIAENKNNNAKGEVLSIVKGDKTFLGGFSINDRSKAIDELMITMINRLTTNLRAGMNKEFKDFLTNKYN